MTTKRSMIVLLFFILSLILDAASVSAHGVSSRYFIKGDVIEGEVGLSHGQSVKGAPVIVRNIDEKILLKLETDENGAFNFTPKWQESLFIEVDLGAGHIARMIIPSSEFTIAKSTAPEADNLHAQSLTPAELEKLIDEAIIRQIKPLRRDIQTYQEQRELHSILGGIGYIVGIFGLILFLLAKRDLKSGQKRV